MFWSGGCYIIIMRSRIAVTISLTCFLLVVSGNRVVDGVLKKYDILNVADLKHIIVKRSLDNTEHLRKLNFRALRRNFKINLRVDNAIFSSSFRAIQDDGIRETEIQINKDEFYKGYVEGEKESSVDAHFEGGLMTAHISTHFDTYVVEPSWRHMYNKKADMIVYKTSDVMSNLSFYHMSKGSGIPSYCGVKEHLRSRRSADTTENQPTTMEMPQYRNRRTVPAKDTCPVALVADYKFFQEMGQSSLTTTVNYMISVLQRTDKIFRNTIWGNQATGLGFEVKEVRVHKDPSGSKGPEYNQYTAKPRDIDNLLTAFSKSNWGNYCLAHLFTYQDFERGVIGLAYVASPEENQVGGICSRVYKGSGTLSRYLNCGLSSSLNWGRRLLTAEADIVTAHELGHNFGADHDADTAACAPSESNDGKFIMYRTSVSGLKPNNKKFSPCSTSSVGKVLTSKSHICFTAKVGAFCGNFKVDSQEDCDPGFDAVQKNSDPCCDANCKFRPNAECSDFNSPCCNNCSAAPVTKICREEFAFACTGQTRCNGVSVDCPEAPKLTGPECHGKGRCQEGQCRSFCQVYGGKRNTTCICADSSQACTQCCSDGLSCSPVIVNGTTQKQDDGYPCDSGSYQGRCMQGSCEKTKQNVVDQFLSLLKDFTLSKFAKFMQENIVGTIIVFSLLLWIPASCIVHYVDKRRDKEEEDLMMWKDPKNTELIRKDNSLSRYNKQAGNPVSPRKPMYKRPVPSPRHGSGLYYPSEMVEERANAAAGGFPGRTVAT